MNRDIIKLSKISGDIGNVEEWRKEVVKIFNNQRMKAKIEITGKIIKTINNAKEQ